MKNSEKPECYTPNKEITRLCKGDELALSLGKCKTCELYEKNEHDIEYSTISALKLCKEGKKMRCPYYGMNCGFIMTFDGKGYHFNGSSKYVDITTELDFNTKWVID